MARLPSRPKRLYVTLDGGWARGRAKGQWQEAKLGSVFPEPRVEVSKDRRRVLSRRNAGSFGTSEQLGNLLYSEAFAAGVESAEQVVVLGDGAGWIKTIQEHHFPHAELRLDAFHGLQALDRGLRAAYPDEAKRRKQHKRRLKDLIWEGNLAEALRRLRLIAHQAPEKAAAWAATIEYLDNHSAYILHTASWQQRVK